MLGFQATLACDIVGRMSSGEPGRSIQGNSVGKPPFFSDEAAAVTRGHHGDLLVVVGLLLIATLISGSFYPRWVNAAGVPDAASAPRLAAGIDPNTARWYEIAQLPGIGETVAKRWVAHRQKHAGDRPAFMRPSDLTRIRGIGDRTLRRIAPFLRFSEPRNYERVLPGG